MKLKILNIVFFIVSLCNVFSQSFTTNEVVKPKELSHFLLEKVKINFPNKDKIEESELAHYFREKFSERYFYDWKNFDDRFTAYKSTYPQKKAQHTERALDHIGKFSDSTQWVLPFNYQNGEPVNAYALRHLARQHKMIDIAFYYFYKNKEDQYLVYFKKQLRSLNNALSNNTYETIEDGNGVYEAFRSGYRVLNWLQIHNMFLGESSYSDEDQLRTIATLLQHGAHLYKNNLKFHPGNHQTRGVSALAMIAILLRDFGDTDEWYQHSMKLLEEHLKKEINDDGFQFERSVHYHISDIGNFYYVYQLAKTSGLEVNAFWEEKLRSLFTTLTKIAYPDKSAPVLQDDTDLPWAEKNDISGALTLGYLLFQDSEMGYFANNFVDSRMYWYLNDTQLKSLNSIKKKQPNFHSQSFQTTGYYIMRNGCEKTDNMMVISAGLDAHKPDHQHGDMLGIQAMANGKVILPNYQVRYSLPDLELFKNWMVKNVALVDNELQGKQYSSNKGGSGFGKFKELPNPKVVLWESNNVFDAFIGSHDGFNNVGVTYSRQVINIKNDFWVVKDNFLGKKAHTFKQIWQGHYTPEASPNLLRATFDDASGCDIFQLREIDTVESSGARGKHWSVVSKKEVNIFSFVTMVFPYVGYENRVNELSKTPNLKGWEINDSFFEIEGDNVVSLSRENDSFVFGAKKITFNKEIIEFSTIVDIYVKLDKDTIKIQLLSEEPILISTNNLMNDTKRSLLQPGGVIKFSI